LHEKGNYHPKDLQTEKAYKDLMNQTFDAFNFAITDNDMPDTMRVALQQDARLFGGLKTHAQLFEASKLLIDEKGNLKPFNQLSHEFDKLNITYNKNYLESEYEFAVGSSQMAAKWEEFSDNDRYELQYRTAGDNRVRAEHDALRDITLPKSDPFWNSYTPPNGWNCRCTVVEVLKDKFPTSDSEKAIKKGEAATTQLGKDGKNRLEIFRFNPGAQKVVFPPAHPYTKVAGAKAAKPIILTVFNSQQLEKLKTQRTEVKKWAKESLIGKTVSHPNIKKEIIFTSTGIKEALNQPHKFIVEKNEAIRTIKKRIKEAEFVKTSKSIKGKDTEYHYLKTTIADEDSYIVIKTEENRSSFYSIVDKLK
jgi:SPP1 gp7 family putative phage head morphogenesis protein